MERFENIIPWNLFCEKSLFYIEYLYQFWNLIKNTRDWFEFFDIFTLTTLCKINKIYRSRTECTRSPLWYAEINTSRMYDVQLHVSRSTWDGFDDNGRLMRIRPFFYCRIGCRTVIHRFRRWNTDQIPVPVAPCRTHQHDRFKGKEYGSPVLRFLSRIAWEKINEPSTVRVTYTAIRYRRRKIRTQHSDFHSCNIAICEAVVILNDFFMRCT